jgi:hypothetical protein
MNAAPSILKRVTILSAVAGLAVAASFASPGDTFATGASFTSKNLDLKIDSKAWYNGASVPSATWALKDLVPGTDKFFNFNDVKPGDFGCNVISIHAQKADAWACLDFKNLKNNDNGQNEPEALVDANGNASGELASGTQMFGWMDDGDGKYEPPSEKVLFSTGSAATVMNDKTYAIGDSKTGGSCRQDTTRYVGMCWCAGNLTVNPITGKMSCDGSTLGNAAQTDSFTVDVNIRALPTSEDAKFTCSGTTSGGGDDKDKKDDKSGDDKNKDDKNHQSSDDKNKGGSSQGWQQSGGKKS